MFDDNIEYTPSALVAEQSISVESDIGRSCEDRYQATGAFNFRVHTSVLVNGLGHLLTSSTIITPVYLLRCIVSQATSSSPSISPAARSVPASAPAPSEASWSIGRASDVCKVR